MTDQRVGDRLARIARLERTPARITDAVREPRPVGVGRARSAEWTPRQVVAHLSAVERVVWHARLADVARETDPQWPWVEPGAEPAHRSLDDLVASFRSERARTVTTLRGLDEAGWARSGTHTTFGTLDVAGLMREALAHDADHLLGLERRRRDLPGS